MPCTPHPGTTRRRLAALPCALALAVALPWCASESAAATPATTTNATEASTAGAALRLPKITIHGDALATQPHTLSVDELDRLAPAERWTIDDPYRQRENTYSGIPLRELVVRLAPKAEHVRMRAVNDYITVFSREEWETLPILLATRDGDARMSVANKGPARIVLKQTRQNALAMQVYAPKWIWQVVDVEFQAR